MLDRPNTPNTEQPELNSESGSGYGSESNQNNSVSGSVPSQNVAPERHELDLNTATNEVSNAISNNYKAVCELGKQAGDLGGDSTKAYLKERSDDRADMMGKMLREALNCDNRQKQSSMINLNKKVIDHDKETLEGITEKFPARDESILNESKKIDNKLSTLHNENYKLGLGYLDLWGWMDRPENQGSAVGNANAPNAPSVVAPNTSSVVAQTEQPRFRQDSSHEFPTDFSNSWDGGDD